MIFSFKESTRLSDELSGIRLKFKDGDAVIKDASSKCTAMVAEASAKCAVLVSDAMKKSNDVIRDRMLIADTKIKTREDQYHRINEEYWKKRDEIEKCSRIYSLTDEVLSKFRHDIRKEFGGGALRYLSEKYVEALVLIRGEIWSYVDMSKAPRAEDKIRVEHAKRMLSEKELTYCRGLVALYESSVPWIIELRESSLPDRVTCLEQVEDEARVWVQNLSDDEWLKLSVTERNALALDRYLKRHKSNAEVGRDYEQFIGWKYEQTGWSVSFHGMIEGYDDLGRDLICKKGDEIHIVQCKCWSKLKQIRESHVNQLFGTFMQYAKEGNLKTAFYDFSRGSGCSIVTPVFVTSTKLSPVASRFADALLVTVRESVELGDFPRIKCNIGKDGGKIYHLPFDQQYNSTVIERSKGEFYAWRVDEAESQGFRRARKHIQQQDVKS